MNNKNIEKYDDKGNLVYYKYASGIEIWRKYDKNNNRIYGKDSNGFES